MRWVIFAQDQNFPEIQPCGDKAAVRGDKELLLDGGTDALDQLAHMHLTEMVLRLLQQKYVK
ncbi:hypothetical protein D3C85_1696490 [compost metagenome]